MSPKNRKAKQSARLLKEQTGQSYAASRRQDLVPKQIVRKDGVVTTVWVRPDDVSQVAGSKIGSLSVPSASSGGPITDALANGYPMPAEFDVRPIPCDMSVDGVPVGSISKIDYRLTDKGSEVVRFRAGNGAYQELMVDWADDENFIFTSTKSFMSLDLLNQVKVEDRDYLMGEAEKIVRNAYDEDSESEWAQPGGVDPLEGEHPDAKVDWLDQTSDDGGKHVRVYSRPSGTVRSVQVSRRGQDKTAVKFTVVLPIPQQTRTQDEWEDAVLDALQIEDGHVSEGATIKGTHREFQVSVIMPEEAATGIMGRSYQEYVAAVRELDGYYAELASEQK